MSSSFLTLLHCEVWLQAVRPLSIVLSNTVISISCAWLANFCYSRGNLTSGKPAADQSDSEFIAGAVLATHFIFFAMLLLVQLPVLQPLKFASMPENEKSYRIVLFCLGKLLKHTHRVFLLSLALAIGVLVCLRPKHAGADIGVGKFYIYSFVIHMNSTSITIATRRIFQEDTVLGRSKQRSVRKATVGRSIAHFVKIYVFTLPKAVVVVLAAVYVQAISKYRIVGTWDFVAFTIGNFALKAVVRAIAKKGAQKLSIRDPRSVFLITGLPTVLIDTQVRIVLQTLPGARYTLIWTLAMAVIEIATRFSKVIATRNKILRREAECSAFTPPPQSATIAPSASSSHENVFGRSSQDSTSAGRWSPAAFAKWKQQVLTFQIAESYANMSAEYIAIGCSTSILYFYWGHPKYNIGGHRKEEDRAAMSESLLPWAHSTALGAQVLAEILVDYVSCTLEISQGADFQRIREYRVFLALLFVSLATVNVQFCAMMYLSVH